GHSYWIVYDSNDRFVRQVRWRQEAANVLAVDIRLPPGATLWGWQASYEGNSLKLELRKPPALAAAPASPLQGRPIIVDPGHSPSSAGSDAVGPMGTREMDVNFAIAKTVEQLLIQRGALPMLTRPTDEAEISLLERARFAVEKGGELFVSIHNNGLPDGSNPFARPRGYTAFYYHPHSLDLARSLYRAYERRVAAFAGEDVRYGNLAMTRISAMPAVLIESLYMMFPAHEEKLNDPAFRRTLAEAIVDGLESFLAAERAKQSPAAPAAAQPAPLKRTAQAGKNKSREKRP
ncbi:MAG: N-acetylmuramoyl-L-alanine amidase, partial [Elusimicrobiota bacterium]